MAPPTCTSPLQGVELVPHHTELLGKIAESYPRIRRFDGCALFVGELQEIAPFGLLALNIDDPGAAAAAGEEDQPDQKGGKAATGSTRSTHITRQLLGIVFITELRITDGRVGVLHGPECNQRSLAQRVVVVELVRMHEHGQPAESSRDLRLRCRSPDAEHRVMVALLVKNAVDGRAPGPAVIDHLGFHGHLGFERSAAMGLGLDLDAMRKGAKEEGDERERDH
eukprot:CAMPEP_0179887900 /NCGR_PEP_ID=MMETSP0982-20121206/31657_1 /TAXON_ID=483367 /ORGANISM="non described non described, Strain CCMP 2436" /LENGTH=223 /DNA_ID=CAMNT_0021783771 /DNA_START=501 /DNA_END=1173 /DNA_ORIENTATION=+